MSTQFTRRGEYLEKQAKYIELLIHKGSDIE